MSSHIEIPRASKYQILREVVRDYPGVLNATESLLSGLERYPRNWDCILKDIRNYALKNFYLYQHHEKSHEVIKAVLNIFFEALNWPETSVQQAAMDSILFYLEKIVMDGSDQLARYGPVLWECFERLNALPDNIFFFATVNPHQLKKLAQMISEKISGAPETMLNALLIRYFVETYEYLLKEEDPADWFKRGTDFHLSGDEERKFEELLYPVSHANLRELIDRLHEISGSSDQRHALKELLEMPSYVQIVKFYEDISNRLIKTGDDHKDLVIKIVYLLKIMRSRAFSHIHENVLREMNRTLSIFIRIGKPELNIAVLEKIFDVFAWTLREYPETTLYCLENTGKEIYGTAESKIVDWFLQKVISLGFQYPQIEGVTDEWQVRSNRSHLKNIRTWLVLMENNPKWSKPLMSALIINLRLCGVHINDTDVFQKDITKLLNSDIKPVYHLTKVMCKQFPVYFNEIGSEGILRQVSTEIDEISGRADILVHFLRKQSHVESSARVVDFMEEVIRFWLTRDKTPLKTFLPGDIYEQVSSRGPHIDDVSIIFNSIFEKRGLSHITDLLLLSEGDIRSITDDIPYVSDLEKKRTLLAVRFYQLLYKKYKLDPQDIKDILRYAQSLGLPNADTLINVLQGDHNYRKIENILAYLEKLKEIIISEERFEPVENIFRKRHIAAGIPSMYGIYNERKFDALALSFRLENLANILFEELIDSLNLKFITRATLFEIEKCANLFYRALQLDGVSSNRLENTLELLTVSLEVRRFSFSQYVDIFRGFSEAVQDILNTYYTGIFKHNLKTVIAQAGIHILPKYREKVNLHSEFEFVNKVAEQFLREIVANSFGLQQLDNFISRILKTLFEQGEGLDLQTHGLLMSYDPKKALSNVASPNIATNDRIHLGSKGYNLIKLASLGIPVPPGFIITTEVFRCAKAIERFKHVEDHLDEGIREHIYELEKLTGKKFGDAENPLLVSVRSGGAISMPGMMISFLDVGMNESIVEGLIKQTGRPWFVWDCYRRFLQCWGMSYGMERDRFDAIINSFKDKYRVSRKIQFTPDQMREVAYAYREAVKTYGIEIVDDPEKQLKISIAQVFESWYSEKAQAYRKIMGISDDWGTAVIVQAMVYGNLDTNSGTGVLFTRNPQEAGDKVVLWGDFAIGAQGEDIVSGLVMTLPISNEQRPPEDRISSEVSFEDAFPDLYEELLGIAKQLIYEQRWGAQEIEFTFEGKEKDRLYILQSRDMAVTKKESFMTFVPTKKLSSSYLSRGIGVGGGVLSGRAVFDLYEIQELRLKEPLMPLILIRSDTVPDDITHISAADGLLTARGGSTSHAAIIANRLGKTCVVGCNNLIVREREKRCKLNRRVIRSGDFLSIDGRNGSVYAGRHKVEVIKAEM
ncbi:MAG: PEP/pyruvate-binding domain-containing protein [Nitrospirota bacterium]